MIFNVGARRSGTYWLQRVVTAHPTVAAIPSETHLLSHGIAPLLKLFQHEDPDSPEVGQAYAERDALIDATRDLCDSVFSPYGAGCERIAERTPLHVLHLALIAEIYPDAKFVHIIRDGRDVARSISAQPWGPANIAGAAREWRECVVAGRAAALKSDQLLEVRYERLLKNPEKEIERLYTWLGLPSSEQDLAYPLAEARRETNVDSRGVSGVATGKWKRSFTHGDLTAFEREGGALLEELGYQLGEHSALATGSRLAGRLSSRLRAGRNDVGAE